MEYARRDGREDQRRRVYRREPSWRDHLPNPLGYFPGSKHFIGFTRVAATGLVTIYTREDGVSWTSVGSGNSTAGDLWTNNVHAIRIGVSGAGGDFCMGGKIFRAKMFAQANFTSTPVLDFNPREGWTENLIDYSNDINNASWTKTRTTVSNDQTTSPSGLVDADALIEDGTAANSHFTTNATGYTCVAGETILGFEFRPLWTQIRAVFPVSRRQANVFGKGE